MTGKMFLFDRYYTYGIILQMSIKIRLETPGLVMQAQLNDEALNEVITLIQKYRVEEESASHAEQSAVAANNPLEDKESTVRVWLAKHAPAEVLNLLKWDSYAEKILTLGAYHEARGGSEGWRSADMDKLFAEAKEAPPSNFPRDISKAIKGGDIRSVTPRTYAVSRTGWNRLADALTKAGVI